MMIRNLTLAAVLLFATPVSAGLLTLTGQDLTWNPLAEPSPTHLVGIENPSGTTDPLFAWSLGMIIVPDPSATGAVEFETATEPSDYLLAGRSSGLVPPFSTASDAIGPIGDSDAFFTGIVVPASGRNLLATTFVASPDAQGIFYIAIVADPFTGANWFSSDFQNVRDFDNVPFGGDAAVVGSMTVVPEPTTETLVLISVMLVLGSMVTRRYYGIPPIARIR